MKCTKCGCENPEDSIFCNQCGEKLNTEIETQNCEYENNNIKKSNLLLMKLRVLWDFNKRTVAIISAIAIILLIIASISENINNKKEKERDLRLAQYENTYINEYEKKNNCIIDKLDSEIRNNYMYLYITVKNNSNYDINYIKVNIYLEDKDGNIIQSDWTNDSSCIKPGATQTLEKMVKKNSACTQWSAEVEECR